MLTPSDIAASSVLGHARGVLLRDERPWKLSYTVPFDGQGLLTVAPDRDLLDEGACELHIPDEALELGPGAAVLMVSLTAHEPAAVERIRWEAYHGEPPADRFGLVRIEAVRIRGDVVDGSLLEIGNPLSGDQVELCGAANAPGLAACVAEQVGIEPDECRAVGVDPLGVHVRGVFQVHRLAFDERARDVAHAKSMIESLLGVAR